KSTSGIVTLAGAANYTGATTLDGGTLIFAQDHSGAALTFGAAAGSANPSTPTPDLVLIGDGKTLIINGPVTIGTALTSTSTVLKLKGAGTFAAGSGANNLVVGLSPAGGNSPGVVDMSELANFTFNS